MMQRIAYCAPLAFRPGPTFAERPAKPAPGRAPLIVTISRHAPRKGLDVLLRALALLRERGVQFRAQLAGDGPIHGALRQLAHELGVADYVEWPGLVPDPLPYLRECEVFALPTIAEDSGSMSVLEALQAGAPIVCSGVDGLPEDLTHEHDALLVPPRDPRALADALARLLGDEQLRGRLSRNARATYEARFAPGPAAADLAGVYSSLGLEAPAHAARVQ
jgi:colanic acid/amylovoran biosynthesis glycosyltransferase